MFGQFGDILGNFLGSILYYLYNMLSHDYGFALIVFTIAVKFLLMPLNIKQITSSMKMQELQPELKKLQDKYKDDREKLNEEMVKFFQTNNYNPANGCIVSFVQLPILIMLWQVISKPITHMISGGGQYVQKLFETFGVTDETSILFNITKDKISNLGIPSGITDQIFDLQQGMHFLGIFNLARIPSYRPEVIFASDEAKMVYLPLMIIPILAALFTYISTKMMMTGQNMNANTDKNATKKQDTNLPFDPVKTQKTMLLIGPIMTLIFAFQLPAGLSLYWLTGYVFQVFQQLYINKTIHGKKPEVDIKKKEVQDSK